jgi:hypothetical protein
MQIYIKVYMWNNVRFRRADRKRGGFFQPVRNSKILWIFAPIFRGAIETSADENLLKENRI